MRMRAVGMLAVLVLLVAAACGEDEPAFDVPQESTTTTGSGPPGDGPEDASGCSEAQVPSEIDAGLDVRPQGPVRAGQAVTWVLELDYRGEEPVQLRFATGQDGDVVLLRGQDEAYRWSEGMVFTQAIRCRTVQAGGNVVFELRTPSLDVAPGEYTLRGTLSAVPSPPPAERPVTVEP